jgi:predicted trehalose synthase
VSYAAAAARQDGVDVPEMWEQRARAGILAAYHAHVDAALLPAGADATAALLALFEIEKTVYELRYELQNRPDWIGIPVAGIIRLLEGEPA